MSREASSPSFFSKLFHRSDKHSNDQRADISYIATASDLISPPIDSHAVLEPDLLEPSSMPTAVGLASDSEHPATLKKYHETRTEDHDLPSVQSTSLLPPCAHSVGSLTVPVRLEKYGLLPLTGNADDAALNSLSPDIVAVHGINGDAYSTWTHENGSFWLRDFLPLEIPGSRVFSFGYPAEVAFTKAKGDVSAFSRTLLEQLKAYRYGERLQCRPLIFICHSMGGIVIKQALITASLDAVDYKYITQSTRGIVFFGTPHRGSDSVRWPLLLANVVNVAAAASSSVVGSMRSDLLRSLEKNSEDLKFIATNFRNQISGIRIISCVEQNSTPPLSKRVVDDDTGTMDVYGEVIMPMAGCDHREVCRFPRPTSSNYRMVLAKIKEISANDIPHLTPKEEACLKSLSFEAMETRQNAIRPAMDNTCRWLFESAEYLRWERQHNPDEHNGFLWLKGKPGSGKSTIMKQAVQRADERICCACTIVLRFYFNARGSAIEKSPLGLYRSLLHQLLWRLRPFPDDILFNYVKKSSTRQSWQWETSEVQSAFFEHLDRCANRKIIIFIDAMDECEEDDARDIVEAFEQATADAVSRGSYLPVCISSRHYPSIRLAKSQELWMEQHNSVDIRRFVEKKLENVSITSGPEKDKVDLKEILIERASGVFLWIFLVVRKIVAERQKGSSIAMLKRIVEEVPSDLHRLFEQLFQNIKDDKDRRETLRLIQWVLFAERPMSIEELRHALAFSGDDAPLSIKAWENSNEYMEGGLQFEYLLVNRSRGLVEVIGGSHLRTHDARLRSEIQLPPIIIAPQKIATPSFDEYDEEVSIIEEPQLADSIVPEDVLRHNVTGPDRVQLIHESVRDFLIKGPRSGFQILDNMLDTRYIGSSHHTLLQACISYLSTTEVRSVPRRFINKQKALVTSEDYPFLDYATSNLIRHARSADEEKCLTATLPPRPIDVNIDGFQAFCRIIRPGSEGVPKDYFGSLVDAPPEISLLHILCQLNFFGCVKALVEAGIDFKMPVKGWGPSLMAASYGGNYDIVKYLLEHGADIHFADAFGMTCLHFTAGKGNLPLCQLLLLEGRSDVNQMDAFSRTPVYLACQGNHVDVVAFLFANGATVFTPENGSAYSTATPSKPTREEFSDNINKLRPDHHWQKYSEPREWRDKLGQKEAKDPTFLLSFEAKDSSAPQSFSHSVFQKGSRNLLSAAVASKNQEMLDLVLKIVPEHDPEFQLDMEDTEYGTPLLASVRDKYRRGGNKYAIETLLLRGADLWAGSGRSASLNLSNQDRIAIIENVVILEETRRLALLNMRDRNLGRTLLHWAVVNNEETIVKLLLGAGAFVNAQDRDGQTPLHLGAMKGDLNIARRLAYHRAPFSGKNNDGKMPIEVARERKTQTGKGEGFLAFLTELSSQLSPYESEAIELAYRRAAPLALRELQEKKARKMEIDEGATFRYGTRGVYNNPARREYRYFGPSKSDNNYN